MIRVTFFETGDSLTGFECKGHSMAAERGEDIVCAAVSSACLMTANTVTDILRLDADAAATDGFLRLTINASPASAQDILQGLRLHLIELAKEYPQNIKVEVQSCLS